MEKIKFFIESDRGKNILTVIIVILVGLGSFGLGRLSKENANSGIKIEYPKQALNQEASAISAVQESSSSPKTAPIYHNTSSKASNIVQAPNPAGKAYFASKLGHKYYSIGCGGGKTLKAENKIYFTTEAEAISAGYEKSSTCK